MGMFGFDDQSFLFDVTPVENQFILEHMPSAKGDEVKVYLYGLMHCYRSDPDLSVQQMAHELLMEPEDVLAAYRHWERRGLVQRVSDNPPAFRYVNVKQHAMLGTEAAGDPEYEAFAESVYALFGSDRRIHGAEMAMCYEWVEDLHLPAEVVILMLQHLKNQRGLNFSIKAAEKLAQKLADENARTLDDAEQVLGRDTAVWDGSRRVLRRMGKRRMPSDDEMTLYGKWLREWGFAPEAIEAACAQTTRGDPSFAYLDGILKGIMGRRGAMSSAAQLQQAMDDEQTRAEPLKRLLSALGARELTVNEGTLRVYDSLRALYADEEIILLAARECAARGGKLEDVASLLEAWSSRGLRDITQVRAHLERVKRQDALLKKLYEQWGRSFRPNNADRRLLEQWQTELGLEEGFILHCAAWAGSAGKPMPYMDALLKDLAAKGIRTAEAADAEHAARQQAVASQPQAGQPRQPRLAREQQYQQREYEDNPGLPDWMREMMEKEDAERHDTQ